MMIRPGVAWLRWVILAAFCGVFGLPSGTGQVRTVPAGRAPLAQVRNITSRSFPEFGRLPVQFIPNAGQADKAVAFYVDGRDKTIQFGSGGLTFVLRKPPAQGPGSQKACRRVVKVDFVEAARGVVPTGLEKSGAIVSYFRGRPADWKTGLTACSKIAYHDLWPGIDLVYQGTFDRLKYMFVVRPGADPSRIRLAVRGAETFGLTADGRLTIQTPAGGFEDDAPIAYQEIDGVRRDVPVTYDLDAMTYGFAIGDYDGGRTLVVDPSSFIYLGFIGGGQEESGRAIAVDTAGNAYITGTTQSNESTFPVIGGPDLTMGDASGASFVAKISPDGSSLVYCGYIAGATCRGIALDGSGNAYLTGYAFSPEDGFPVAVGPDLTHNGGSDAFVAKVNASGTALDFCGYVGGASGDMGNAIAVDPSGNAYITGMTHSSESTFPILVGPGLTFNSDDDAFVVKVDSSGSSLVYCGYIGSSGRESGLGIAVDFAGYAYIVGNHFPLDDGQGNTLPPYFPEIVGPDLTFNGFQDCFVAKVDATGAALLYCGYIGGLLADSGNGIAVDNTGNAYVTGFTDSDQSTFPVTLGPDLTFNGRDDAFVAKVNPAGTTLVYCGYIGGAEDDYGFAIALDGAGNAYVTGETDSDETTFPVKNGPDRNINGWSIDAFVAKVESSGGALAYCGYVGGSGTDDGYGIAVDASGSAYVVGSTMSPDLPSTVGPDLTYNYNFSDVLVAKIPANPVIYTPVITSLTPPSVEPNHPAFTLVVHGTDFTEGAGVDVGYTGFGATFVSETELQIDLNAYYFGSGGILPIKVHNPGGEVSSEFMFYVNNPIPVLDSVEPAYLTGGGQDTGIFLKGSGFVENSIVRWNGQDIYTGLSWTGEGWAIVPESLLAQSGNALVTVYNPNPAGGTSGAWTIPVTGYALGTSPQSVTVTAGQQAVYTIQVSPELGPFDSRIEYSCGDLPRGCTKSFYPAGLIPGESSGTTTLTLTTSSGSGIASGTLDPTAPAGLLAAGLLVLLAGLWPRLFRRGPIVSPSWSRWVLAGAAVFLFLMVAGCGSGGSDDSQTGTPKGTYNVRVDAKSGTMTVSTVLKMVVQ